MSTKTVDTMYPDLFPEYAEEIVSLRAKKRHDYASGENPYSNFDFTGWILDFAVQRGVQGADLSYIALLTTKLSRMIELRGAGKEPKNEPIADTLTDMAVYTLLWREDLTNRGC